MTTANTTRVSIIVTAAKQADANAAAKAVDTAGGENTFTVGLSPNENAPYTHYMCYWQMTPSEWTQLQAEFTSRNVPIVADVAAHWDVSRNDTKGHVTAVLAREGLGTVDV